MMKKTLGPARMASITMHMNRESYEHATSKDGMIIREICAWLDEDPKNLALIDGTCLWQQLTERCIPKKCCGRIRLMERAFDYFMAADRHAFSKHVGIWSIGSLGIFGVWDELKRGEMIEVNEKMLWLMSVVRWHVEPTITCGIFSQSLRDLLRFNNYHYRQHRIPRHEDNSFGTKSGLATKCDAVICRLCGKCRKLEPWQCVANGEKRWWNVNAIPWPDDDRLCRSAIAGVTNSGRVEYYVTSGANKDRECPYFMEHLISYENRGAAKKSRELYT